MRTATSKYIMVAGLAILSLTLLLSFSGAFSTDEDKATFLGVDVIIYYEDGTQSTYSVENSASWFQNVLGFNITPLTVTLPDSSKPIEQIHAYANLEINWGDPDLGGDQASRQFTVTGTSKTSISDTIHAHQGTLINTESIAYNGFWNNGENRQIEAVIIDKGLIEYHMSAGETKHLIFSFDVSVQQDGTDVIKTDQTSSSVELHIYIPTAQAPPDFDVKVTASSVTIGCEQEEGC